MATIPLPAEHVGPHCESCGRTVEPSRCEDGYTSCCNECICYGHGVQRFGTDRHFVRACCWARAEILFGGADKVPEGSSRLG